MGPIDILEAKRMEIEALCKKYGVARLRLFGSSLKPNWDPENSDFDFVAEFGEPPLGINLFLQQFGLVSELESLLGRQVDVVDWNSAKRPEFRSHVEAQARNWYAV